MNSKITLPILAALATLSCAGVSSNEVRARAGRVAGVYERCPFHCETVTLLSEGRFEVVFDGDLFNNQSASGDWIFDRNGFIVLNSDQQPLVRESSTEVGDEIKFKVVDQDGLPLSVYGFVDCPESSGPWYFMEGELIPPERPGRQSYRLGEDGFIYVSECKLTSIFVELYSVHTLQYTPVAQDADTFLIVLDTTTDFYVTGERYRWKPGLLYDQIPDENGGGWTKLPLKLKASMSVE